MVHLNQRTLSLAEILWTILNEETSAALNVGIDSYGAAAVERGGGIGRYVAVFDKEMVRINVAVSTCRQFAQSYEAASAVIAIEARFDLYPFARVCHAVSVDGCECRGIVGVGHHSYNNTIVDITTVHME